MEPEIKIVFQPIYSADTMEIYAYEELMRFPNDTIDNVINNCKQYDDFYTIERLTFFRTLAEYESRNYREKLFINSFPNVALSKKDMKNMSINHADTLTNTVIEIVEHPKLNQLKLNKKKKLARRHDLRFAIDDYGTVNNTYSNLLVIKPTYLKIDRSVITGIDQSIEKQEMLNEILYIAEKHDCFTIAEGIETEAELDFLKRTHVNYYQGFLLGKPK